MNSYEYTKQYIKTRKQDILYVMGTKCALCGYNKCSSALELHHLVPEEKDFSISQNVFRAWESIKEELKKTILVCANCHREIHSGLINNSLLVSTYDENKANEISARVKLVKKQDKYCLDCGTVINHYATRCPKCSAIARQQQVRPTRDELKYEIWTMPFTQIASKYQVTDNSIRKWCKSMNLPSRKKDILKYSLQEWEKI